MRHAAFAFVLLLAAPVAADVVAPTPLAALPPNTHRFTLANGLEGIVVEDHRAPVATAMVWYKVGSADEGPDEHGVAHFLEHLMFEGTAANPGHRYSQIIALNGGEENALTSFDYTAFFVRIAAERLPVVLALEADRMVNLQISEDAVAVQRDVVAAERREGVESSAAVTFNERRRAALYRDHPYGRPVIGRMDEIEALDDATVRRFYATHYAPNNAVLVIVGDVEPEDVERHASATFGSIPSVALPPRQRPGIIPHPDARRLEFRDPRITQPAVGRLYLAPSRRSGDQARAAALVVLDALLGEGDTTSVLARALTGRDGIAIEAGSTYVDTGLDQQSFGVFVAPRPGIGLAQAESALDAALERFLAEGPAPADLARVKAELAAEEIYALDDQMSRARTIGIALTTGLTLEDVAAWPDALAAVTLEDVLIAATELFQSGGSVTGWLLPQEFSEQSGSGSSQAEP